MGLPRAWLPGREKLDMKMSDNLQTVIIVITLCCAAVLGGREVRGCYADKESNIATCVRSGGDAYLCCINYRGERGKEECIDQETARKLLEVNRP